MNVTNILSDIDFLCGSTSATYPVADKIRNINIAYHDTARVIWSSSDAWQYDDSNATTLPIARTTLVHNQQDYSLPSTAQRLHRIEVKNSNGDWVKLEEIDMHDISQALPEYYKTAGLPQRYDLVGRSIMLYPKPSSAYCSLTSGLAVYIDRDVTEFPTTATTTEPGFAKGFHRILSYAAALDFTQDEGQRRLLLSQKDRLEKGLVNFYSKKMVERTSKILPANKRKWRQYT